MLVDSVLNMIARRAMMGKGPRPVHARADPQAQKSSDNSQIHARSWPHLNQRESIAKACANLPRPDILSVTTCRNDTDARLSYIGSELMLVT